jgi:hypothetical protein
MARRRRRGRAVRSARAELQLVAREGRLLSCRRGGHSPLLMLKTSAPSAGAL